MRELEKAALFEQVTEMLEDIDSIFKEYGFDPEDFDEDELTDPSANVDEVTIAYGHVSQLRRIASLS